MFQSLFSWFTGRTPEVRLNGPVWPDAQPWDMWLFMAVAIIIVLINRKAMLDRHGAVVTVLMPGDEHVEQTASAHPDGESRDRRAEEPWFTPARGPVDSPGITGP